MYNFPPMLGPAEQWPEGTKNWAECLGVRLRYQTRMAYKNGVSDLIPTVRKATDKAINPKPWEVWPEPPAGTPDAYFSLCTGYTYRQLVTLISTFEQDHGLALCLEGAQAGAEAKTISQGTRTDLAEHRCHSTKLSRGNTRQHLLRRLAREHPETLASYERGDFPTVRAAARSVGFRFRTPLQELRSAWKRASEQEKSSFLKEIKDQP